MSPRSTRKGLRASLREYSGGVKPRELPGLWKGEWKDAYAILTRDHPADEEPKGWFRKWWYRTKTLFVEFSSRLTPPRRVLFAICLILAFLGLEEEQIGPIDHTVEVWERPALLVVSIVGLVFLLVVELADRIRVRDELEVARLLQRELLPQQPPPIDGYRFAFSYRSANTVGGDFYEFLSAGDRRVALAIGDASGHGIAAAMLMTVSNATLKLAVDTDPAPLAVAEMMNRAILGVGGPRAFLTLFYALLDPAVGRFDYVCVGHPFPLLRRRDGEILALGEGSLPLGLRPRLRLSSATAEIHPGDRLLLYTDGIPEATDAEGEAFGFDRLQRSFEAGGSPQEVHDRVFAQLESFERGVRYEDDRSLVVIGRL